MRTKTTRPLTSPVTSIRLRGRPLVSHSGTSIPSTGLLLSMFGAFETSRGKKLGAKSASITRWTPGGSVSLGIQGRESACLASRVKHDHVFAPFPAAVDEIYSTVPGNRSTARTPPHRQAFCPCGWLGGRPRQDLSVALCDAPAEKSPRRRGNRHDSYFAPVAQLDRASVFGTEGWGFESLRACFLLRDQTHLVTKNDAGWTTENVVHPLTRAILSQRGSHRLAPTRLS